MKAEFAGPIDHLVIDITPDSDQDVLLLKKFVGAGRQVVVVAAHAHAARMGHVAPVPSRPPAFIAAIINAIGEISKDEALRAIEEHWATLREGKEP